MANYTTLRYGSSGDEVKKLQEKLGINADGIYGSQTQKAVEDYQRQNGLRVDGIAGNETQGHMFSTPAVQSAPAIQAQPVQPVAAPSYRYNADADPVYQQALQQLEAAKGNKPVYAGTYDDQLKAIFDKIMNREDFSYDLNGDAFWNQLKDQKVQQGQMAMMDAMGQAAALTGGYGNTYGQQVGQQAYHVYLQQLYDQAPELYKLALSRHQMEGDKLSEQFTMTGQLAGDEYAKYQDALTQYWQGVDRAQSAVDTAYDRGQNSWYTEQQMQTQADDTKYSRQQDAYDKLVSLISSTGYTPSQAELQAAGMSAGEAAAYAKYYADQNTPKGTGGGDPNNGKWASGIDTKRGTGEGQLKGSAWDYTKNNLSRLLATGNMPSAEKYMDQIVDDLNKEQYEELMGMFDKAYGRA